MVEGRGGKGREGASYVVWFGGLGCEVFFGRGVGDGGNISILGLFPFWMNDCGTSRARSGKGRCRREMVRYVCLVERIEGQAPALTIDTGRRLCGHSTGVARRIIQDYMVFGQLPIYRRWREVMDVCFRLG